MDTSFDEVSSLAKQLKSFKGDELDEETQKKLDALSHSDLLILRSMVPSKNKPLQNILGPYEHQAFAREQVKESPVSGSIGLAVATPAYTISKLLGLSHSRSDPSLSEVAAGYKGIGQGLQQALFRNK